MNRPVSSQSATTPLARAGPGLSAAARRARPPTHPCLGRSTLPTLAKRQGQHTRPLAAGTPDNASTTPNAPWQPPPPPLPDPFALPRTVHRDNLFAKLMIAYFAKRMAAQLGRATYPPGYDGFVDLSREIVRGRSAPEQRAAVAGVLASLLPPGGPARFRALFPLSKWSAEANAVFTMAGFKWLVGPMVVEETEVDFQGRAETWRSAVKIEKCRYLEEAGCAGLCVNLCQRPTQEFFADAFGLPLRMEPNFEDLSCVMKFGVPALPYGEDPAREQTCFQGQCPMAVPGGAPCPKIDAGE